MDYSYARQKMTMAVYGLACGTGALEERVFRAFVSFGGLSRENLPEHLQKDFLWVCESFNDGRLIEARSQQAQKVADRICDIAFELHKKRDT